MKENLKGKLKLTKPDLKESDFWRKPIEGRPFAVTKIKTDAEKMNKKAQMGIMIGLLIGFIVVTTLIALIPGFVQLLDIGMGSDGLNCHGSTFANDSLAEKSGIGCLAFKLYIPYLVLAVLIGLVTKILYDKGSQPTYNPYQ